MKDASSLHRHVVHKNDGSESTPRAPELCSFRLNVPFDMTRQLTDLAESLDVSATATTIAGWLLTLWRWHEEDELSVYLLLEPSVASGGARILVSRNTSIRDLLATVHAAMHRRGIPANEAATTKVAIASSIPAALVTRDSCLSLGASPLSSERQLILRISQDQPWSADVECSAASMDSSGIKRLAESTTTLLYEILRDPDQVAFQLNVTTQAERELVIERVNDTSTPYHRDSLIHELFERQAARTPSSLAIVLNEQSLTYSQLEARASDLAKFLVHSGVHTDRPVAVFVDRCPDMVVALLAILKAGGAYLPLDPSYPAERLKYMLHDAAPLLVLTQEKLRPLLPRSDVQIVALDSPRTHLIGDPALATRDITGKQTSDSLVYVIYTSGSTGLPKGIAMPHRAMVNLVEWHQRTFITESGTRVAQFAALSFDVAFQEIFSTLCTGGCLVLMDEWVRRDSRALMQYLKDQSIKRLFLPPLVLQGLAQYHQSTGDLAPTLQDVITAGEQLCITAEIRRLFERLPGCRLHNHYGPTESHVVTAWIMADSPQNWPTLPPIGRPISNSQIYVLDEQRQPVPMGLTGEIYIGGANVARGYLGKPELTQQRFIPNPFSSDPADRLYKTGDLGRWRADGALDYLGRNDDMVKIRGFRIELGEIEAHLASHELVGQAAVVARTESREGKRLVAYVTARTGAPIDIDVLRGHLQARLPGHMTPHAFVVLDHMPLTSSGKLDRKLLPAPTMDAVVTRPYEAPGTDAEAMLAALWADVLNLERIGRHDHFFELGGDSLLIVRMLEQLRIRGFSIPARTVYECPVLEAMASALRRDTHVTSTTRSAVPMDCSEIRPEMLPLVDLDSEQIARIADGTPGGATNVQDIYPLTPLQEGILFHHLFNASAADTYVVSVLLSLGSFEQAISFANALQRVIDRHSVLRSAIFWKDLASPVQVVHRKAALPLSWIDLAPGRDAMEQLTELMKSEQHQRLDLSHAPLMALELARDKNDSDCYALFRIHHLACDHESLDTLFAEVSAHVAGNEGFLPAPAEYREHVAHTLSTNAAHDAEAFFRSKLSGVDEPTTPFGLANVLSGGDRIAEASHSLSTSLAVRIRRQARKFGVGPSTLFHAAWALVVSHTSGRDDVVFGTLLLGRMYGPVRSRQTLGMFMNTLPLRLCLRDLTSEALISLTQSELAQLLSYEQTSLALAQRCSDLDSSAPLFSTLLNYRHSAQHPDAASTEFSGFRIVRLQEWTNYPITLSVDDHGQGFSLLAQTDQSIDPQRIVDYTITAMQSLLHALELAPRTMISNLIILPENERRQVVELFNSTHHDFPRDKLVHQMVEDHALRAPSAVAVIYDDVKLTYSELNAYANQLARHLMTCGVGPDERVVIFAERSVELVIGILAVLKAGGAYVPIDVTYPADRLAFMLNDCAPVAVLTQQRLLPRLPDVACKVVCLDNVCAGQLAAAPANLDIATLSVHSLVYVIYTSGSTGQPKGVMISHQGLTNLIHWHTSTFSPDARWATSSLASVGFDAATWEIFSALGSGSAVTLAPAALSGDVDGLLRWWSKQRLDISFLPTPMAEFALSRDMLNPSLQTLLIGGDRLRHHWKPSSCSLVNNYGPTEVTVVATSGIVSAADEVIHIGRPIANTCVYILNGNLQPVPIGVLGEIYVGGAGISRGYLSRPELTAERFINDPFSRRAGERMYKTGDLARWLPDGNIEFLGRNDHQIKIRGNRIELQEIERQLARHPLVKEAVVVAQGALAEEQRLIAYVVPSRAAGIETVATELQSHLASVLPQFMVPAAFVTLEQLPLTPNGKVDRRALPPPTTYALEEYEPPRGDIEATLAEIWGTLLKTQRVGRNDDFFNLGGNSLIAMKFIVRARALMGMDVPVKMLFQFPTIAKLSVELEQMRHQAIREVIAQGGHEVEALLENIAAMPESEVKRLLEEL